MWPVENSVTTGIYPLFWVWCGHYQCYSGQVIHLPTGIGDVLMENSSPVEEICWPQWFPTWVMTMRHLNHPTYPTPVLPQAGDSILDTVALLQAQFQWWWYSDVSPRQWLLRYAIQWPACLTIHSHWWATLYLTCAISGDWWRMSHSSQWPFLMEFYNCCWALGHSLLLVVFIVFGIVVDFYCWWPDEENLMILVTVTWWPCGGWLTLMVMVLFDPKFPSQMEAPVTIILPGVLQFWYPTLPIPFPSTTYTVVVKVSEITWWHSDDLCNSIILQWKTLLILWYHSLTVFTWWYYWYWWYDVWWYDDSR